MDLKTGASLAANLGATIGDDASNKPVDNGKIDPLESKSAVSDEISRNSNAAALPEQSPEPGPQKYSEGSEG